MKCRNCGAEIPTGEVVCPICGHPVQLVPDYSTVDYMLREKRMKEEAEQKKLEEEARDAEEAERRKKPGKLTVIVRGVLIAAGSAALIYGMYTLFSMRNGSNYRYQYHAAETAYDEGRYAKASAYLEKAISLNPDSGEAKLLGALLLSETGNKEEAQTELEGIIADNPDDLDAYRALITICLKADEPEQVSKLLKRADSEQLNAEYPDYVISEPVFSIESGIYDEGTTLGISSDYGTVYYTLTGEIPDENSTKLDGTTISLPEGKTVVKAVTINKAGVLSAITQGTYTIRKKIPDAPVITPESGSYAYGTKEITIDVPEGSTVYYVFDGTPSDADSVYTGPIEMPSGTHVFAAILKDAEGTLSEVAERTYTAS
jgi:hypothetical protein